MAKRISDRTRIINFALDADREELAGLIETLQAIMNKRFSLGVKQRKRKEKEEPLPAKMAMTEAKVTTVDGFRRG